MAIYVDPGLWKWFVEEYPRHSRQKLDMGKSCVRVHQPDDISYQLISELMRKISVEQWIERYESAFRPKSKVKKPVLSPGDDKQAVNIFEIAPAGI